jgi:protein-tyrosine phosphatase
MAEVWAVHHFGNRFVAAEVRSAGVIALDIVGDPAVATEFAGHPFSRAAAFAVEVMDTHGLDLSLHRTRRITAELIDWADTVIVMEPRHAEHALELRPAAGDRIEGLWIHADGEISSIWDPQGRTLDEYRTSARMIGVAVERLVEAHLAARRRQG